MKYGRYKIVERLGKGSMGEVFLAHDPHIDRKIALKVLHKEHLTRKEIAKRFVKEAKAIGRLSHPYIVSVYDVGQAHGTIYIAMEYLEGQPLHKILKSNRLDTTSVVKIGRQVATALDYAHKKGIVHRDIKPSNLMITKDLEVKLTDFGIARFDDPSYTLQTRSGDILGTPAYMSPEQIAGEVVDKRSDIYSLGVILYELLVGQRPFKGNNLNALFNAITQHNFSPPKKANPAIPSDLNGVILKSMEKNPGRRYQSGAELAKDLGAYLSDIKNGVTRSKKITLYRRFAWAVILMLMAVCCWQLLGYINESHPGTAFVHFSSDPSDASIYLDNTFKGRTPMRCELPLGIYDVRLTLEAHYESEAQIDIDESGEIPVHLRLIPKD